MRTVLVKTIASQIHLRLLSSKPHTDSDSHSFPRLSKASQYRGSFSNLEKRHRARHVSDSGLCCRFPELWACRESPGTSSQLHEPSLERSETQPVSRAQRWGLGSSLNQDRRKLKDTAADSKDDINKHFVICFWLSNKLTSNFIYSVHKCFLSIYFLPTTILDPRDI